MFELHYLEISAGRLMVRSKLYYSFSGFPFFQKKAVIIKLLTLDSDVDSVTQW